jgi:hypothetical protein
MASGGDRCGGEPAAGAGGDLYAVLGLKKECSDADLKGAYRKLAMVSNYTGSPLLLSRPAFTFLENFICIYDVPLFLTGESGVWPWAGPCTPLLGFNFGFSIADLELGDRGWRQSSYLAAADSATVLAPAFFFSTTL